jgi:hypothetical protein
MVALLQRSCQGLHEPVTLGDDAGVIPALRVLTPGATTVVLG